MKSPHNRSDGGESLNEHDVVFGIDVEHGDPPRSSGAGRPSREETAVAAAAALLAGAAYGMRRPAQPAPPQRQQQGAASSVEPVHEVFEQEADYEEGGSHRVPAAVTSFNFRGSDGAEGMEDGPIDQSATDLLKFFGSEGRPKQPEAGKGN